VDDNLDIVTNALTEATGTAPLEDPDAWKKAWKGGIDEKIAGKMRDALAEKFRSQNSKAYQAREKARTTARTASSTRAERIAAYQPRERETKPTRGAELRSKQREALTKRKNFNTIDHCLTEISKESTQTGNALRRLVAENQLQQNGLVGLFSSGSLTQKVFLRTLQDTDFQKRFGAGQVNILARGLSFIGPRGKEIPKAKKAFQSKQGEAIFKFLERNNLLETQHVGGQVVYLQRI